MEKSHGSIAVDERSWPEVVDDYSHLPQHYQRSNVPPEAVKQEYPQQTIQQTQYTSNDGQRSKRYWGFTMFQLIVIGFLALSVILGAVLGGIFGSGVLSKRRGSRDSDSSSVDGINSGDNTPSTYSSSSFDDFTTTPTPTATGNPTSTRNPLTSATETGLSAAYCNNGTTYTDTTSTTYLIVCQIDWPDNNVRPGTGVFDLQFLENQSTMADCLDECSNWQSNGLSTRECHAVVWNYQEHCYLKNQTGAIADTFYEYDARYIQAGIKL